LKAHAAITGRFKQMWAVWLLVHKAASTAQLVGLRSKCSINTATASAPSYQAAHRHMRRTERWNKATMLQTNKQTNKHATKGALASYSLSPATIRKSVIDCSQPTPK
jgi:hypothetical protein